MQLGVVDPTQEPVFNSNMSPSRLLENVYDRLGNHYDLSNIIIDSNAIQCSCDSESSYFRLYFEEGCGMEDVNNVEHINRRKVVCKVFEDLSNFINSPLKNSKDVKVNILFKKINRIGGYQQGLYLSFGSGYYNIPQLENRFVGENIIENEVWKTIHTGIDSYTNVAPPPALDSSASTMGKFYHGVIGIDFQQSYNLKLDQTIPINNEYDLYSVVMRAALQTLGLTSLIDSNGNSVFGNQNNYYSRYDTHLDFHSQKLLKRNSNSCSPMYSYNFSPSEDILHFGCTNSPPYSSIAIDSTVCDNYIEYRTESNYSLPVYTPTCFEKGVSLSCFEDSVFPDCSNPYGNNSYFITSNILPMNIYKRSPKPEERLVLCEIGYSLNSVFAEGENYSYEYHGSACSSITVAGINDGIKLDQTFQYSGNVGSAITISNILENDANYENGEIDNNNLANLRFECLQDVYYPTTTNLPTSTETQITIDGNDANATITFKSLVAGIHLLRYVPYNIVTGQRGNVTYIWVYNQLLINCQGVPSPNPLEYVINGGFEQNDGTGQSGSEFYYGKVCGWQDASVGLISLSGGGTADTFGLRLPSPPNPQGSSTIPTNGLGTQVASTNPLGINPNNYYAGMSSVGIVGTEIIKQKLRQPLLPNTQYRLRFEVSLAERASKSNIKFEAFLTSVNNPQWNNWMPMPIAMQTNDPTNMSLVSNHFSTTYTAWDTVEIVFTTPNCSSLQYLYIGAITGNASYRQPATSPAPGASAAYGPTTSYYYLDNVSLQPTSGIVNNAPIFNLPEVICYDDVPLNLNSLITNPVSGGVFTGTGVSIIAGNYVFNPSGLATNIYTISYIYTPNNSCPPITITRSIEVSNCAQLFISQVYVSGDDQFIEIKNKSNTQTVAANSYYLANFANNNPFWAGPAGSISIPQLLPQQKVVFKKATTIAPTYALFSAIDLPANFNFDGLKDVLIITSNNTLYSPHPYNNRIDLAGNYTLLGDNTPWLANNTSLVRTTCATQYPRIDLYDPEDWVAFTVAEVADGNSKKNSVLGRHNDDDLIFGTTGWTDASIDMSNPDRSRREIINTPYDTTVNGSFEACSLITNAQLNIAANQYASVQTSLLNNSNMTVQNNGSLVMVKDQFHGIVGNDLVLGNPIQIERTTTGLDAYTDYVYWSSPLTENSNNLPANSVQNLFPAPPFVASRFYQFHNENFQDIPDYPSNVSYANGYDDNLDDYLPLTTSERAGLMKPGLGYCTRAKQGCAPACNYTIQFYGQPNNGVVTVPVYHNAPSNEYNNLVGNPYPSAIDLNKLFEANASLIDPVALIWGRTQLNPDDTPNTGNTGPQLYNYNEDSFAIYNPTMMVNPNPFNDTNFDGVSDSGTLASCQSFFVTTKSNSPIDNTYNSNLIFNNSMRTTVANNTFMKHSSQNTGDKLWLNLLDSNAIKIAQIGIAFLNTAIDDYDSKEDVKVFRNRSTTFYSIANSIDLIINTKASFNINKIIPLGITTSAEIGTQMSISIDKKQGVFNNQEIYIYDKLFATFTEISKISYVFKINNAIMDDRFLLVFIKNESDSILDSASLVQVYNNKHSVTAISEFNKKIKTIVALDIYTSSFRGLPILTLNNINKIQESFMLDEKYKIVLLIITLEDGTIVNKKIMN